MYDVTAGSERYLYASTRHRAPSDEQQLAADSQKSGQSPQPPQGMSCVSVSAVCVSRLVHRMRHVQCIDSGTFDAAVVHSTSDVSCGIRNRDCSTQLPRQGLQEGMGHTAIEVPAGAGRFV